MKLALLVVALALLLVAGGQGNETLVVEFPDAGEEINTTVIYDGFSVANGSIVAHSDLSIVVRCTA